MLKVIILNEIKCFPFENIKEAETMLELALSVNSEARIVKLDPDCIDGYLGEDDNLFIVLTERKNKFGFYDKDGYVFTHFDKPYFKEI